MELARLIEQIGAEWDEPNGCLWQLRQGHYDPSRFERLKELLEAIDLGEEPLIDRRLVSLVWFIPIFMTWQRERVEEVGGSVGDLDQVTNKIAGILLNDVFGPP